MTEQDVRELVREELKKEASFGAEPNRYVKVGGSLFEIEQMFGDIQISKVHKLGVEGKSSSTVIATMPKKDAEKFAREIKNVVRQDPDSDMPSNYGKYKGYSE